MVQMLSFPMDHRFGFGLSLATRRWKDLLEQ